MLYRRRLCLVSSCALVAVLSGCGDVPNARVEVRAESPTSTTIISYTDSEKQKMTTTTTTAAEYRAWLEGLAAWEWIVAVAENAETVQVARVRAGDASPRRPPAAVSAPNPVGDEPVPAANDDTGGTVVAPSTGRCGEPYPPCAARQRESGGNYRAVNPNGRYRGAWQFSQSTWNGTAARAGRPDLVGVLPDQASVEDQDEMARVLWDSGRGCAHWSGPAGNEC